MLPKSYMAIAAVQFGEPSDMNRSGYGARLVYVFTNCGTNAGAKTTGL
jgi:hypothetical protein